MEPEIKFKAQKQKIPSEIDLRTKTKKKKYNRVFLIYIIFYVILSIAIVLGAFYAYKFVINKFYTNKNESISPEVKDLAEKVGDLMILPKDELPTIATVANTELLKGQSFFIDAKKGDKVLIYKNAKKAVLYDPVQDKIITIAPLIVDEKGNSSGATLNPSVQMLQY